MHERLPIGLVKLLEPVHAGLFDRAYGFCSGGLCGSGERGESVQKADENQIISSE